MGAEEGNYTASDLGMSVGLGVFEKWKQDGRNQRGRFSLGMECVRNRPPNGDQTLSQGQIPAGCNTFHLPPPLIFRGQWSPPQITNSESLQKKKILRGQNFVAGGMERRAIFLCLHAFTLWQSSERGLHHHHCGFRALRFPQPGGIKWTVPSTQRHGIPTV